MLHLLKLCRVVSSKYARTRVRQFLPVHFADLIDELLHRQEDDESKRDYYQSIIETIMATDSAQAFIIALAELIQRLAIARLRVGDTDQGRTIQQQITDLQLLLKAYRSRLIKEH